MIATALLAVPMAGLWMIVSGGISAGSFFVGYVLGFAILMMLNVNQIKINFRKLPDQIMAFGIYTVTLMRDIWLSSMDVAKRVLDPNMPMKPGMIAVRTQDVNEGDFTAAFSAHGITITPGELVVDFDGKHTMYVHCLDVDASSQSADNAQTKRLSLLKRIQGGE
jgi:multicomponent Na+:H+ antiporter subunit E